MAMKPVIAGLVVSSVMILSPWPAAAVQVELGRDVDEQISANDSLQDVFPQIDAALPEGRVPASLVDGRPQPDGNPVPTEGNSVVLDHRAGPVRITWDLGANGEDCSRAQLKALTLWLVGIACKKMDSYQQHPPNFIGQLSVSVNGRDFTVIPGSRVELIAPHSQEFNRVAWAFQPGEAAGFRYLRVESFGHQGESVRIAEIDGWLDGITPAKSTEIATRVAPLPAEQVTFRLPVRSPTEPLPAVVRAIQFTGDQLVLKESGRALLNLAPLLAAPDARWTAVSRQLAPQEASRVFRRDDGLQQTRRLVIGPDQRLTLTCEVTVPAGAAPVAYTQTALVLAEALQTRFDGCTYGGVPSFVRRDHATSVEIGDWVPYLIFPCREAGVEVQLFMPAWYGVAGRIETFTGRALVRLEFFAAANNRRDQLADPALKLDPARWHPAARTLRPGETFRQQLNLAVFDITPPTLGQRDIETGGGLPLMFIDTGIPNQKAPGVATVLQRDKMLFMGFKLREPVKAKIGHSAVDCASTLTAPGMVERLHKAGFGAAVLMADEFIDVSHGVSFQARYDQAPPNYPALLRRLADHGITPVCWFSPRGFLNKDWQGRMKDRLVEQHPAWFVSGAHWFGNYQTLDTYNDAANQWVLDKLTQDLRNFPGLKGFAFDSFPCRGPVLGGPAETTMTQQEQDWLRRFSQAVHGAGQDNLLIANGVPPMADDSLSYDYIVTEHFPLMFLNQVLGGRAFGKPFIAHCQWRQMYGWYVTLGQMYYNFCDYDQALGWTHMTWLGWLNEQVAQARKPVDAEVVPLWYIMGKGRRVYAAEIAPKVRQIEVLMPDGASVIVVASLASWPADVQVVPQTIPPGTYRVAITADTALKHADFPALELPLTTGSGLALTRVAPCSLTVLRFAPCP
ncbi:MAG: hypothetical protein WC708_06915 [Lentisphaeria bacterium]